MSVGTRNSRYTCSACSTATAGMCDRRYTRLRVYTTEGISDSRFTRLLVYAAGYTTQAARNCGQYATEVHATAGIRSAGTRIADIRRQYACASHTQRNTPQQAIEKALPNPAFGRAFLALRRSPARGVAHRKTMVNRRPRFQGVCAVRGLRPLAGAAAGCCRLCLLVLPTGL
ncbi:hypothetical protein ABH899_004079 [Paenibacillus sp. RC84]